MYIKGQNSRSWLCLILLLGLIVRSMIPTGFMPGESVNGKMQMVICTSKGSSIILVDSEKYSPTPSKHNGSTANHNDICPFAPVLAQDIPVSGFVLVAISLAKDATLFISTDGRPQGLPRKPWFSQGPPAA